MLTPTALIVAGLVAGVGGLVFWANPQRTVNRVVLTSSLHVAAWLACFHLTSTGFIWLKIACAVGGTIPIHIWLVKEVISNDLQRLDSRILRKSLWWVPPTLFVAIVPFTTLFIPAHSTAEHRVYGWGYYAYIAIDLGMYVLVVLQALRRARRLTGGRQLELQVWLYGACGTGVVILGRMALRALILDNSTTNLQPIAVLVCYAGGAYAITTHRVFDARQIMLLALEKTLLVASVATAAFILNTMFSQFFSPSVSLVGTTGMALWAAAYLNQRLDRLFKFFPDATVVRQAIFGAARKETRVEELRQAFISVLKGWGHTDHALILMGGPESMRGGDQQISAEDPVVIGMHQLRWVTPERLTRERSTPTRDAVAAFLEQHRLGAMVIAEGPTLTVFIGVGVAASRRPFTYPQVIQLMEVASIMESALERALFSVKAQRAEQLATVGLLGASLAHEIRNPLVTIKTFVQLLPNHYQDAAFRSKFFGLIGDEVTRIDQLTEQLLDMASPHTYSAQAIELHPVLASSVELVAAKATDKGIQFETDFQAAPDLVFTDGSAAKQVLLNLCFNAIQAVESRSGERWVKVCTHNVPKGIEMTVQDSGPGISPEIRPRLFQPFQTTKSSGFGLGLAICSDILAGLDATISVDPSVPGKGATFRVVFPCPA
jgi:signal transduction histidine kinase